jgi:hypothetical protein
MAPQKWLLFTIWKQNPGGTPYSVYYSSQYSTPVTYDAQCRQVTCQLMRSRKTHLRPVNDTMHTTVYTTTMHTTVYTTRAWRRNLLTYKIPHPHPNPHPHPSSSNDLVSSGYTDNFGHLYWHENWMIVSSFCKCACVVHSEKSVGRVTASGRRSLPCNSTQPVTICSAWVDESRSPHGTKRPISTQYSSQNFKETDNLGDLGVDGTVLKFIFWYKRCVTVQTGCNWLGLQTHYHTLRWW